MHNIHEKLRSWKLSRDTFPLFVTLSVLGVPPKGPGYILADDVGQGETQVLVNITQNAVVDGVVGYSLATHQVGGKAMAVCCSS